MNLTKKTILALGLLTVAGVGYAQNTNTTTSTEPVGVLGQSFSEVHFDVADLKHTSKNQYGLGVAANVPVSPFLDLGAGYDYGWIRGLGHFNSINGSATAYTTFNGVKPFAGAMLGYEWDHVSGLGNDNQALWGLQVGVEIPVSVVTITPRIVYTDDFRSKNRSSQQVNYGVGANYWVTKTVAVFADVGYADTMHSAADAWTYRVGARLKF